MSLRIEQLFGYVSLQGAPLLGLRGFGVPPGGCFDRESQWLANSLIGNERDAPCLELALCKVRLHAQADVSFGWVGAGASNAVHTLQDGGEITLEAPRSACRSYLAIPGGVVVDSPQLRTGSSFRGTGNGARSEIRLFEPPSSIASSAIRIVPGPQAALLSMERFCLDEYEVSQSIDRTGIRLNSSAPQAHSIELASEPAIQGAVQVPPDGHPIVLGPDGPTIGGYPKIAVVIQADWNRLGQLRPGERVKFEVVSMSDARELYERSIDVLNRQVAMLLALSSLK